MLMPTKHTNFAESLIGLGSYLLANLNLPKSIDDLWDRFNSDLKTKSYPAKHSFDNFLLALVFLYGIGVIQEDKGVIRKCD